jgi:ELWxxDGT repeat protein
MLKDVDPSTHSTLFYLATSGGKLFFGQDDEIHGSELWRSDGSAEGTELVQDINRSGSALPWGLTDVQGTLFFVADDGHHGRELWKVTEGSPSA